MSAETGSSEARNTQAGNARASAETRGRAIFISYRRDDTEGEAGRLYDDLVRTYGDSSVFMDVAGIEPGLDFRKAIDENVAACGVLLAVIGPTWATITGHDGTRRLDNPSDYVRLEIASALKRGIPVIPVLVHDAHMPALEQLPEDIKDLRYRNSVELTHARWSSDAPLLISALKHYVQSRPAHPEATVHATVPVQLPAPQLNPPSVVKRRPFALGIALGAVTVVAALALIFFLVLRPRWQARHANAGTVSAAATPATSEASVPATPTAASPAAITTVATTAATTPASSAGPQIASPGATVPVAMVGVWRTVTKIGPKSDSIEQLSIVEFGGKFSVRAYGACLDQPCDWGVRKLAMENGYAVSITPWEPRNTPKDVSLQRKVSISMALNGDTLLVTVKNQTVDPQRGNLSSMRDLQFKRTP